MASISNDTDPEGKTKILTVLQIKLPHCNSMDNITIKVDNGAEETKTLKPIIIGHPASIRLGLI